MVNTKTVLSALLLNPKAIDEIKADKNALLPGALSVVLFSLIYAALYTTGRNFTGWTDLVLFVLFVVGMVATWCIILPLLRVFPLLFGGKAASAEYLRVTNYAAIPAIVALAPWPLGVIGTIWTAAYWIIATKEVHNLGVIQIVKGSAMLLVAYFIITMTLLPYAIKPYGSIYLSQVTLVSHPEPSGFASTIPWRINAVDNIDGYPFVSAEERTECVQKIGSQSGAFLRHTFYLSPAKEAKVKDVTVNTDKACCVKVDGLGKTLEPNPRDHTTAATPCK